MKIVGLFLSLCIFGLTASAQELAPLEIAKKTHPGVGRRDVAQSENLAAFRHGDALLERRVAPDERV
jgi:hypothetical protein